MVRSCSAVPPKPISNFHLAHREMSLSLCRLSLVGRHAAGRLCVLVTVLHPHIPILQFLIRNSTFYSQPPSPHHASSNLYLTFFFSPKSRTDSPHLGMSSNGSPMGAGGGWTQPPQPPTEAALAAAAAAAAPPAPAGGGGGRPSGGRGAGGGTECRYGTGCKRANCSFGHPRGEKSRRPGRVWLGVSASDVLGPAGRSPLSRLWHSVSLLCCCVGGVASQTHSTCPVGGADWLPSWLEKLRPPLR